MKEIFLAVFTCLSLLCFAQSTPEHLSCGQDHATQQLYAKFPGLEAEAAANHARMLEEGKRNLEDSRSVTPPTYIIPVVFHIIHDYGYENISDAQVIDAVRILNENFRKLNADTAWIASPFDTLAADCEIEFRLAQLDPNGNCTNGIDRIASMETYVGDDGSKLNQWPRDKYLNIWVTRYTMPFVAGYTYAPSVVDPVQMSGLDGIIMLHDYIGSIGTGSIFTAKFLTHEVAHWLSIPHPWGSGPSGVACGDDGIADTPITKGWTVCQLTNNDVCNPGTPENVENFMDGYCLFMFTPGQRDMMHLALNSSVSQRNNLWTNANLIATGALDSAITCLPIADFGVNYNMICDVNSVTFDDATWNSAPTAWEWTLTGPVILTSTSQNPLFTNIVAGSYDVTLIATNSAGSDTLTRSDYILVSDDTVAQSVPFFEGFEIPNAFSTGYIPIDEYGNGSIFMQTLSVGHSGTGSAMLNAFTNPHLGDKDVLITPAFDLTNTSNWQLTFVYASATTTSVVSDNTQVFKVYSSIDCGRTWTQRMVLTGMQVPTVTSANNFVPASSADWDTVSIILPFNLSQPNVRFKFEFTAPVDSAANNLYIDDINIASGVGIAEQETPSSFTIYPNPGDGNGTIAYTLDQSVNVTINIYDISGRLISSVNKGEQAIGNYTMPLNENVKLAPGTYIVEMIIGDRVSTEKYVSAPQE
jgi:PKD repeat protein